VPALPIVMGTEAAGVVEEVGTGATSIKVGDRVAYPGPMGAYSEVRLIAAENLLGCLWASAMSRLRP